MPVQKVRAQIENKDLLILILMVGASLVSMVATSNIDQIVNHDLYNYGLQFSTKWAVPYWTMEAIVFSMGWLIIVTLVAFELHLVVHRPHRLPEPEAGARTKNGRILEIEFGWPKLSSAGTLRGVSLSMLLLGFISLLASVIYDSYVTAFVGLGLTFWGALLLVITPTKYVKLELLTAASSQAANTEKLLNLSETNHKGVYLPPRLLRDYLSSLVFVPATDNEALPKQEEIPEEKTLETPKGLFLTPPGQALSRLFEEELGKSFTELSLNQLATELPSLLDELAITKTALINVEAGKVTFQTGNYIFKDLCLETQNFQRTHETVGCPFSSAIACTLAKSSGKPVTIEKEEHNPNNETTTIHYQIQEE